MFSGENIIASTGRRTQAVRNQLMHVSIFVSETRTPTVQNQQVLPLAEILIAALATTNIAMRLGTIMVRRLQPPSAKTAANAQSSASPTQVANSFNSQKVRRSFSGHGE